MMTVTVTTEDDDNGDDEGGDAGDDGAAEEDEDDDDIINDDDAAVDEDGQLTNAGSQVGWRMRKPPELVCTSRIDPARPQYDCERAST